MSSLSKSLNSAYPIFLGLLLLAWIVVAGVVGVTTKAVDGLPVLLLGFAFLASVLPLFCLSKLKINPLLVVLVLASAIFFSWRAETSLIRIYALADFSLVLMAVAAWLAGSVIARSRRYSYFMILGLVVLLLANAYVVCQQYLTPGWNVFGHRHPNLGQITGFFFNRNYFGGFSALCGCVFLGFSFWSNYSNWLRIGLGIGSLLAFSGVAISESRGAVIAAVLGLGVFFALSMLLRVRLKLKFGALWTCLSIFAVVVGLAVSIFSVSFIFNKRSNGQGLDQAFSSNGRTETLWLAFKVGEDSPVIGHGARSFEYESIPRWGESNLWVGTGNLNFVHNEYGQAFADYGGIGLALLLMLILLHLGLGIWHLLKLSGRDLVSGASSVWPAYLTGGISALLVMCVQANFSFVWHFPVLIILSALLAGAIGNAGNTAETSKKSASLQKVLLTVSGAGLAAVMLWVGMSIYPGFKHDRIEDGLTESRVESLKSYVDHYPDWKAQKELAELTRNRYIAVPEEQAEKKSELCALAIEEFERAFDLHPKEPGVRLALADLLSQAKRFDEAEAHFQWVLKNAKARAFWLHQYWVYGIHLHRRAVDYYMQRRHQEALRTMKLAKNLIDRRPINSDSMRKQSRDAEQFIKYLEEEIIPYLPE